MRGTVEIKNDEVTRVGITPAHAGNSHRHIHSGRLSEDHPRSCGEQNPLAIALLKALGSPPLMRGTEKYLFTNGDKYRITPAHAGNREILISPGGVNRDHPRSCGEQSFFTATPIFWVGSPPLMRGTVSLV